MDIKEETSVLSKLKSSNKSDEIILVSFQVSTVDSDNIWKNFHIPLQIIKWTSGVKGHDSSSVKILDKS